MEPIPVRVGDGNDEVVIQFSIRCHRCVPLPADELERWLQAQTDELRAAAPQATVRLSRLRQGLPSTTLDIGWLVEVELPEDASLLADGHVADLIRDMRLVGLQPTLLEPVAVGSVNGSPQQVVS